MSAASFWAKEEVAGILCAVAVEDVCSGIRYLNCQLVVCSSAQEVARYGTFGRVTTPPNRPARAD